MNRKRLIIYSLLALPIVIFVGFFITLDPLARGTFFREFKANTLAQFGYEPELLPMEEEPDPGVANTAPDGGEAGGGGFDPAAVFARRDADGDGMLTGEEISGRMQESLERIDADQDGAVTLEEFTQAMPQMRRGGGGRNFDPNQMFAERDADGDGQLSEEEMSDRMRENLEQIDADQDGAVTLEEFTQSLQQMRNRFGSGGGGPGGGGPGGDGPGGDPREGRPDRPARPE